MLSNSRAVDKPKIVLNTVITGVNDTAKLQAALKRIKSKPGGVFPKSVSRGAEPPLR